MPYRYSFTGPGEIEYYEYEGELPRPTPAEKEKFLEELMEELAVVVPYRGVIQTIPEKPAGPDKKLAKSLRIIAKKAAKELRAEQEADDKVKKERRRKEEAEARVARVKLLEEVIVPPFLDKIKEYAGEGERRFEIETNRAFHYISKTITYKHPLYGDHLKSPDLIILKDIFRRYGFRGKLKKKSLFSVRKYKTLIVLW